MKNTNRPQKMCKQPSKETRWAYMMQAIEPKSEAINKAFPDYHPQWVQTSQMMRIAPENFVLLRLTLGATVDQCAAYLRVNSRTIQEWESGKRPVPFAEFELLRLVIDSMASKFVHKLWDGWFLNKEGKLVSPNERNRCYGPDDLNVFSLALAEKARLSSEVQRLQAELESAVEENTKLRQMFLSQGVVDELYSMHDRLADLVKQMATARIVSFQTVEQTDAKKKTA